MDAVALAKVLHEALDKGMEDSGHLPPFKEQNGQVITWVDLQGDLVDVARAVIAALEREGYKIMKQEDALDAERGIVALAEYETEGGVSLEEMKKELGEKKP